MEDKQKEFGDIFERHSDELFRHAFLRLSDRERALDLTQETFFKAWNHISKKDAEEIRQWRSFLYRILNNLIIDEYRKHKTQSLDAMLANEETSVMMEGELLRDETNELEAAIVRFDGAKAMAALEELGEQHKAVLILRYVDGLSPREIAESLGQSENTVSVRIHRGIKKLQQILGEQQPQS